MPVAACLAASSVAGCLVASSSVAAAVSVDRGPAVPELAAASLLLVHTS